MTLGPVGMPLGGGGEGRMCVWSVSLYWLTGRLPLLRIIHPKKNWDKKSSELTVSDGNILLHAIAKQALQFQSMIQLLVKFTGKATIHTVTEYCRHIIMPKMIIEIGIS